MNTITEEQRAKVSEIIMAGLVVGAGNPRPGEVCLESAICLALGEDHGDDPSCVAGPDRAFAIRVNDRFIGTPAERAELLLPLGLAQLVTAGTDRKPWVKLLAEGTIRRVVPIWLRAAAEKHPDAEHKAKLEAAAQVCEREGTRDAALGARSVARSARDAAAYAAAADDAAYAYDDADADATRNAALRAAVSVALAAYRAEGRHAGEADR